jgi:hypothetical protein
MEALAAGPGAPGWGSLSPHPRSPIYLESGPFEEAILTMELPKWHATSLEGGRF